MVVVLSDIGYYFDMGWIWDVLIVIFGFMILSVHILFTFNYNKGNLLI